MAIILNGTSGIITPGITNTGPFIFEGPVTVPAGTASSPSVSFTGSTNTGLYLSATGAVSISTAGTQRVVVSASGDVGIGTNTPATKLAINGGVQILAGNALNFQNAAADANGTISNSGASGNSTLSFNSGALLLNGSGNLGLGVTPSTWTVFKALEIGAVGSGMAAYSGGLNFFRNAYYNGGWKYAGTGVATLHEQSASGHAWFNAASGTAGNTISFTQAMTLDDNGQLNLGTTTAINNAAGRRCLTINGTSTSIITLAGGGAELGYMFHDGTAFEVWNAKNGSLEFGTNNTERARITSGGSFGIGTTTVSNLLQVAGAIGLNHSAMTSAATSGDFTITVGGLQSLAAGNAWYVTSVLVFYVGIDGDQTDGNLLVTALYLRGLSTWGLQSTTNIVGTATVTGANATATSLDLTFDVSNDNLGSVYALVLGGNGGSRPTISIAG